MVVCRTGDLAARGNVGALSDDADPPNEQGYAEQVRAFRAHAAVFAGVMLLIFLVNLAINAAAGIADIWWAWWSAWAFVGWGIGVVVHGLVVRQHRPTPTQG